MFARFFSFVLLAVVGLGGCATNRLGPDDTKLSPDQPKVSSEVMTALVGKKMTNFPVYVSGEIGYYDLASADKIVEGFYRGEVDGKEKIRFTTNFPILSSPPKAVVADAVRIMTVLKSRLREAGFTLAESQCEKCLTIKTDFAEHRRKQLIYGETVYFFTRFKVFYLGQEVFRTRDDIAFAWGQGIIKKYKDKNDVLAHAADEVTKIILEAWEEWEILTAGRQQISAAR